MNNFHALLTKTGSCFSLPLMMCCRANLMAALNAPRKNNGTVRITETRLSNTSFKSTRSKLDNPSANLRPTTGPGTSGPGTVSGSSTTSISPSDAQRGEPFRRLRLSCIRPTWKSGGDFNWDTDSTWMHFAQSSR